MSDIDQDLQQYIKVSKRFGRGKVGQRRTSRRPLPATIEEEEREKPPSFQVDALSSRMASSFMTATQIETSNLKGGHSESMPKAILPEKVELLQQKMSSELRVRFKPDPEHIMGAQFKLT